MLLIFLSLPFILQALSSSGLVVIFIGTGRLQHPCRLPTDRPQSADHEPRQLHTPPLLRNCSGTSLMVFLSPSPPSQLEPPPPSCASPFPGEEAAGPEKQLVHRAWPNSSLCCSLRLWLEMEKNPCGLHWASPLCGAAQTPDKGRMEGEGL